MQRTDLVPRLLSLLQAELRDKGICGLKDGGPTGGEGRAIGGAGTPSPAQHPEGLSSNGSYSEGLSKTPYSNVVPSLRPRSKQTSLNSAQTTLSIKDKLDKLVPTKNKNFVYQKRTLGQREANGAIYPR